MKPLSTSSVLSISLALLGTLAAGSPVAAQHDGDVWVGRSSANQLKIGGFAPDQNVIGLPCVSGLFQGWADNSPGFDRVQNANVADLFPMEAGAQIRIVCLSIDPALRAISSTFVIMDAPGESILLGGSTLHAHLTWHINSIDPLFVPTQTDWFATFKLIDTGSTGYAESAPFTFRFTNAACPVGDCNDDGSIDGRDVQAFIAILLDPDSATARQRCLVDANRDCSLTPADVHAFVGLLLGA